LSKFLKNTHHHWTTENSSI